MTESKRLKLALVGCGNIARAHWRGIRYVATDIDVTAVVDADAGRAEAMAERTGAAAFTSLVDALADGDFDAVDPEMVPDTQNCPSQRPCGRFLTCNAPPAILLA